MTAESIAIGTEILLGQIVDSNSAVLGETFSELGIDHFRRQTVGDSLPRIVEALQLALSRADIVVAIGGLGPTQDDLTREAIALALGDELVHDASAEVTLRAIFERRKLAWVDAQLRQCMRPLSGACLLNPNGTAPGLFCQKDDKIVIALPGPKEEFSSMLRNEVVPRLLAQTSGDRLVSVVARVCGIGEAQAESMIPDLIAGTDPTVAPYAKTAEVHFRITAKAKSDEAAHAKIKPVIAKMQNTFGSALYGFDDQALEGVVLQLLREKGKTLAVAESCTGGGLGSRITSVPGSSDVFLGGVISYANAVKTGLLNVSATTLANHGAVSEECALEMASGVAKTFNADYALSITGVAGPGGGTEEKPVGLVYIGMKTPTTTNVKRLQLRGMRLQIRERSIQNALLMLYNELYKQKHQ